MFPKSSTISVEDPPKWFRPRQLRLLGLLADPTDVRTLSEKAKEVGVSRRTVSNWRQLPGWNEGELLLWSAYLERARLKGRQITGKELVRILWDG